MKLKLITFSMGNQTVGKLYYGGVEICRTIELPWRANAVNVSCIPAGVYDIEPIISPRFGETYTVKNVLGRSHILFHKANWAYELHGCIAPVSSFGVMSTELAGLQSGKAYNALMELLFNSPDYVHTLEIERH